MTTEMSVEETVKKIVTRIVRKPDTDFLPTATFKDFNADSLDIVQILVAVEDAFDIEMQDEELQEISDMGGFVAYIERKIAEKGNS
ncbi:acyl carrier protein [Chloroflexota bacterium]